MAILGIGNKPQDYTEKDIELVSYLADVVWEITDRKGADEALRESEERFQLIFKEGRFGFTIAGPDYKFVDANPSWTEVGENAGDSFGWSVASAGDVNGDSYDDVIIGAPWYDADIHDAVGKVYVYHGSSSGLLSSPSWTFEGPDTSVWSFGNSVSSAGDVNNDGYDDVIIGPYDACNSIGKVYGFYGSSSGLSTTPDWETNGHNGNDCYGGCLDTAGDVNNDGYDDVIIGALNDNEGGSGMGKVYVYHGSSSGLSTTPDWLMIGGIDTGPAEKYVGEVCGPAGDVNGDGYDDVIINSGAPGMYNRTAWVYHGSSSGLGSSYAWKNIGPEYRENFAKWIATAGDVNNDGYDDVIIGAPYAYNGTEFWVGKVYVYHGSSSGLSTNPSWTVVGENSEDQLGNKVYTAGDVNNDGYDDIIISAIGNDDGGDLAGKAYIYYGSSNGLCSVPSWTDIGEAASDLFGYSIKTAGDVNNDGYDDIIIGARLNDDGGSGAGKAYVYHGEYDELPNSPPNTPNNPNPVNHETDVSINTDLSWTGGDPDSGDTVTYDVYFGTSSSPPKVSSDQSNTNYDPGTLETETIYYWKIVATDNNDATTEGPIWDFTTGAAPNNPPNTPSNPSPDNHESDVSINTDLSWTGGDPNAGDTVIYDVFFGTISSPPEVSSDQSSTSYDPGTLEHDTMYYWKIVATDNNDATTEGPVWDFTTGTSSNNPPNTPSNPSPSDHETDVSINTDLSWTGGDPDGDPVTYDVYFGTTSTPSIVSSSQSSTSYDPGTLNINRKYFWFIVAEDNQGASKTGTLWDFTTGTSENNPPNIPVITGPSSGERGKTYYFNASSTDPDNDELYYWFDWGDDTDTGWVGTHDSGDNCCESHMWGDKEDMIIKVKSKDINGLESDWATHEMSITKTKTFNLRDFFISFLNDHPLMFPVLRQLLGLE